MEEHWVGMGILAGGRGELRPSGRKAQWDGQLLEVRVREIWGPSCTLLPHIVMDCRVVQSGGRGCWALGFSSFLFSFYLRTEQGSLPLSWHRTLAFV